MLDVWTAVLPSSSGFDDWSDVQGSGLLVQFLQLLTHLLEHYSHLTHDPSLFATSPTLLTVPTTGGGGGGGGASGSLQEDFAQGYIYDEWVGEDQPWNTVSRPAGLLFSRTDNNPHIKTLAPTLTDETNTSFTQTQAYLKQIWASILTSADRASSTTTTTDTQQGNEPKKTTTADTTNTAKTLIQCIQSLILHGIIRKHMHILTTRLYKELAQSGAIAASSYTDRAIKVSLYAYIHVYIYYCVLYVCLCLCVYLVRPSYLIYYCIAICICIYRISAYTCSSHPLIACYFASSTSTPLNCHHYSLPPCTPLGLPVVVEVVVV